MFKNTVKPSGRPRSFDEKDALEKATQVFWSKGYDGVTIDDLVTGMGVGRPSLYSIFGNKQTLFLRVLKAYADKKGARAAKALLAPKGLRDALAGFLRYAVESATEEGSAQGCLALCVAPLVSDVKIREILQNGATATVALVELRFQDGISAGEISSDFPVAARAMQTMDFVFGMTMRAQIGTPRKTLLNDVEEAVNLLLLQRRGNSAPGGVSDDKD
jgi:AcrR family transcriptional regulator